MKAVAPVYSNGRVYVLSELCPTCIFRPGNLMRLSPGRVAAMVKDALADDAGSVTCHSTLYGQAPQQGICRGWWERYASRSMTLRLAIAVDIVTFISFDEERLRKSRQVEPKLIDPTVPLPPPHT